MTIPRVLIIAGSDSSGGAGIAADIKAVAAAGGHAMPVVTALTAQNTTGVQAVHTAPLSFVRAQFESVTSDIQVDAIKTGMLASAELVELVAELVADLKAPLVVDPVMVAKGGDRLLAAEAVAAVKEKLLPLAAVATPNLDEAEEFLGRPVRDRAAMEAAAAELAQTGAGAVLLKGGHLAGDPGDLLHQNGKVSFYSAPRIETPHTHGTGCTLASALATYLGAGWELAPAVMRARLLVRRGIAAGLAIGAGHGPVNAMADLAPRLALGECLDRMEAALQALADAPGLGNLVPEVRGQLAFALPGAASWQEVVAVAGRITNIGDRMKAAGPARAGASRHVAKIVLAAMAADPDKRAAMALLFDEGLITKARAMGWKVGEFSRADEPAEVKEKEGSSLEWGTSHVIARMGCVPDLVFDRGEDGKEPVMRLIAADPEGIVKKLLALAAA